MKAAILALLMISGPALADTKILHPQPLAGFDLRETTDLLMEANFTCVSGQNHDGEKVADSDIEKACDETIRLLATLKANGWCTDANRTDWFRCKD